MSYEKELTRLMKLFPIGSHVKLIKISRPMSADINATGYVMGYFVDCGESNLDIQWDKNDLYNGQHDGEYSVSMFEVISPPTVGFPSVVVSDDKYPHICDRCGAPAYKGLNDVDCSKCGRH